MPCVRMYPIVLALIVTELVCGEGLGQAPQQMENDPEPVRLWTHVEGNETLEARLIGVQESYALLERSGGQIVAVPLEKLSVTDRQYVRWEGRPVARGFQAGSSAEELPAPPGKKDRELALRQQGLLALITNFFSEGEEQDSSEELPASRGQRPSRANEAAGAYAAFAGEFLNAVIQLPVNEDTRVSDVILGTYVTGDARTDARATIELVPSPDHVALDIILQGISDSATVGFRGPVRIHSQTATRFVSRKRIALNAGGVHIYPAVTRATTDTQGREVSTDLGGIAGRVVGRIAGEIVASNSARADQAAAEHAARRISYDLDQRINGGVARWHGVLQTLLESRVSANSAPRLRFRTTPKKVEVFFGDAAPPIWNQPTREMTHDIVVVLSESVLTKVRRAGLAIKMLNVAFASQRSETGRISIGDLKPNVQQLSEDGQWMTLAWNVARPKISEIAERMDAIQSPPVAPRSDSFGRPVERPIADPRGVRVSSLPVDDWPPHGQPVPQSPQPLFLPFKR